MVRQAKSEDFPISQKFIVTTFGAHAEPEIWIFNGKYETAVQKILQYHVKNCVDGNTFKPLTMAEVEESITFCLCGPVST